HGINTSRQKPKSVTYVSGTNRHLCLGPLKGYDPETWVMVYTGDMVDCTPWMSHQLRTVPQIFGLRTTS
ncbi:hypothetical protein NKH09_20565, partial [Mesorhizobium sp. M1339]|uniref:hypothetical protein n=1 Tax=unclassified Mesorhizobium TaxID=325217 RepID=UPI00333DDE60